MSTILFLSSDLMFSSRVMGASRALGIASVLAPNQATLSDKLTADCRLAIIDLSLDRLNLPTAIAAIKAGAPAARVIAYGAHVNEAALADAANAGCDLVLSNRQFNQQYTELIRDSL